ncbi:hypothetical protein KKA53_02660 [Candidatus Dependentiae bacterium]|nr:hypothetical protein [Candidatus Dependentiae bacterium]
MLTNFLQQNTVPILFELSIFLILVIQLYQITIDYGLPLLREQIAELYKQWNDLENKFDLTKNTKNNLCKKFREQTTSLNILEESIQKWHASLAAKQAKNESQQKALALSIFEKKKRQFSRLSILQAKKEILPDAIAQTRKTLLKSCQGAEGKKLLANVIKTLDR